MQLLFDRNIDVEAKDNNGKIALLYVAINGGDITVQLLFNRDANIEANDINDNIPLGQALRS